MYQSLFLLGCHCAMFWRVSIVRTADNWARSPENEPRMAGRNVWEDVLSL